MRFASKLGIFLVVWANLTSARAEDPVTILHYTSVPARGPLRAYDPSGDGDRKQPLYGAEVLPVGIALARKQWIRDYVQNGLREDLIAFLTRDEGAALRESSLSSWIPLSLIPMNELTDDIRGSRYVLRHGCRDSGGKRREGTTRYTRKASICFDAGRIMRGHVDWDKRLVRSTLMGLAIHEHLHHFGYADSDDRINRQFAANASTWIFYEMNAPERMSVTPRFRELRDEYRNGLAPSLGDAPSAQLRCDLPEFRQSSISDTIRTLYLPALEGWLKLQPRFSRSSLDSGLLEISTAQSFGLEELIRPPAWVKVVQYGAQGAWMLNGPTVLLGPQSSITLSLVFTASSPDRVVGEIVLHPQHDRPNPLHGALTNQTWTAGYVSCAIAQ